MKTLAIVLILVGLVAVGIREFSKHENSNESKRLAVANDLKTPAIQKLEVVKTATNKSRRGGGIRATVPGQFPVVGEIRKVSLSADKKNPPVLFSEEPSERWVEMAYFFNPGGGYSHTGSETSASNDHSVVSNYNDHHDQDDWNHKEVADRSSGDGDRDHDRFEKPDRLDRDDDREHDRFEKPDHHGR